MTNTLPICGTLDQLLADVLPVAKLASTGPNMFHHRFAEGEMDNSTKQALAILMLPRMQSSVLLAINMSFMSDPEAKSVSMPLDLPNTYITALAYPEICSKHEDTDLSNRISVKRLHAPESFGWPSNSLRNELSLEGLIARQYANTPTCEC